MACVVTVEQTATPEPTMDGLFDAIRALRATKTPATWTPRERELFALLPEARAAVGKQKVTAGLA